MKRASMIYSSILLASFSITGFAQQSPTRDLDKNKAQGTVDADRDRAGKTGHMGSDFGAFEHRQLDLDKDGRISKNEYEQAFSRMDMDRDGYLSSQEFRHAGSRSMKSSGDPSGDRGRSSDSQSPDSPRKPDPTKTKDTP